MKSTWWFICLCLPALLFSSSMAATDVEGMDALKWKIGTWSLTTETWDPRSENWRTGGTSTAVFTERLDGTALEEMVSFDLGGDVVLEMINWYTYDNVRATYRVAMLDKMSGVLDLYVGLMDDEALVIDNLAGGTPYVMPDGNEMYYRISYTKENENGFVVLVEATVDEGDTWIPFARATYTR